MVPRKKSNERVTGILNSPTKKKEECTNVLSWLFRSLLEAAQVSPIRWSTNMERYLKDPRNRISRSSKDASTARGNLMKELTRNSFTWKIFEKGIRFLGPKSVKLVLEVSWANGTETRHEIPITVTPPAEINNHPLFQQNQPFVPEEHAMDEKKMDEVIKDLQDIADEVNKKK